MTSTRPDPLLPEIRVMTKEEIRDILDQLARRYVDMSGEEFIEAWESGKYDNVREFEGLTRMVFMIPLTR